MEEKDKITVKWAQEDVETSNKLLNKLINNNNNNYYYYKMCIFCGLFYWAKNKLFFSENSIHALETVQWIPARIFRGVKRPRHEPILSLSLSLSLSLYLVRLRMSGSVTPWRVQG